MKKLLPLLLFVLLAARVCAQEPAADPTANLLVDCGPDKAVVFEHTASADNNFALAWTLLPRVLRNQPLAPAVDWTSYSKERMPLWLSSYEYKWRSAHELGGSVAPYKVVEGVVDLRDRKFTPLLGHGRDYNPLDETRRRFAATWSDDQDGTRYALADCSQRAGNNLHWRTTDLWLVKIDRAGKVETRDLGEPLFAAVVDMTRKYDLVVCHG